MPTEARLPEVTLRLNMPELVGGFLAHLLNKRSEHVGGETGGRIPERGVIIASGLMAGGELGGVFGAALGLLPKYRQDLNQDSPLRERTGIAVGFCADVHSVVSVCVVRSLKKAKGRLDRTICGGRNFSYRYALGRGRNVCVGHRTVYC